MYANDQGEPVAYWLFSAQSTGYSDRGTARNERVGGTWNTVNSRVEANRTGFPAAAKLGDGSEIIISHNTGANPWAIWMAKKAAGGNTWVESALPGPSGIRMLWPKIAVGGPNNMTIHIIAITAPVGGTTGGVVYQGLNGHILYYRSTDGGATWDKQYTIIPGLDNSRYDGFSADSYTIDASGDDVAIGIFRAYDWNDIRLFKSTDNGNSWNDLIVRDFPDAVEGYSPAPDITYTEADVAEGDTLSPDPFAVMTSDGFGSVLLDQNGQAHVWFGRMYVMDNVFTDSSSFIYPGTNGIMYWKESWGANNLQIIAGALDYDGDNVIISSNDQIAPYGGANISSFPVTGIGADGTIYMCYSAVNEQNISSENDEFLRSLYLMKSSSNGEAWGEPLLLTAAPYVDESLAPFVECVWPSLPRNIGDKVWVLYQQDYIPGSNVWGAHHPAAENFINWIEVDPTAVPVKVTDLENNILAFQAYPNPVASELTITFESPALDPGTVEVYDIYGRLVKILHFNHPSSSTQMIIHVENLTQGVYFLKLSIDKMQSTKRFTINR
jgi:hypothetical protein